MRYIIIMRKNNMKLSVLSFIAMMFASSASAQYAWQADVEPGQLNLGANVHYNVETQASFSNGKTPLWLNANKYGLSSLEKQNGYVRASVIRPLQTDSARRWGIGYGVDVAAAYHYTSKPVVQQAFVEARWLHGVLSVGAKQYPMELKNNALSSGAQTLGINARPVPQVRIALPEYWTLPFANHWLHLKGHIAYGRLTDNNWQHEFTNKEHKYADNTLYHSKAGYLMIGNPDGFYPFSVEMGLETATLLAEVRMTLLMVRCSSLLKVVLVLVLLPVHLSVEEVNSLKRELFIRITRVICLARGSCVLTMMLRRGV